MKGKIPIWVYEYAHSAAKIPFVKTLLKPFYYRYKERVAKERNQLFKDCALDLLCAFDKCMINNNFNYCLIFGTLLGAIREGGFIPHDCDIDVALYVEERSPELYELLRKYGFRLIHRFMIGDGQLGCEETFEYLNTGVTIDIFYICPPIDEYPYVCCWNYGEGCATYRDTMKKYGGITPRRIELPFNNRFVRVPFESIEVCIPENPHEICKFCYGEGYMTPDPNYIIPTDHRVVWNDVKAKYEEF